MKISSLLIAVGGVAVGSIGTLAISHFPAAQPSAPSAPAQAAPIIPTDFKGFVLGAPFDDKAAPPDWKVRCWLSAAGDHLCSGDTTFAQIPTSLMIKLGPQNSMDSISITFETKQFSEVREALVKKFGAPSEETAGQVSNLMGASASNRSLEWQRPDGAWVSLQERGVDMSTASVFFLSKEGLDRSSARQAEQVKARQNDL